MSEPAAVLFANDAFYLAFATRDLAAMDALWAKTAPVSCSHPGWQRLSGRDAVMESWRAILTNPASPRIECRHAQAGVIGAAAVVTCYERLPDGFLVATNVFVREDGAWRMIHHQAGPAQAPADGDEPATEETMQ